MTLLRNAMGAPESLGARDLAQPEAAKPLRGNGRRGGGAGAAGPALR